MAAERQAFPNDFARENTAGKINDLYDARTREELRRSAGRSRVAGRIMLKRVMGKASFITLQDLSGRIQATSAATTSAKSYAALQALGHRRHRRRRRHAVSHAHRRADRRVLGDPPALPSRCGRCRRSSTV
jgi:lysyl-tRNA synthetase class II